MADRQVIEQKLQQKMREIQQLEDRLREARGYVRALRELLGLDPTGEKSMVDQARDIILAKGHTVHITELLREMGKEITRESRVSLTSALSAYVRRGDVFVKVGPNRFGLRELKHRPESLKVPNRPQPPDDFGQSEGAPATPAKKDNDA